MPTLARLAARGEVGRAAVIPPRMAPGSDVGNMSILGYDPSRYHTGRAPIEAAALGAGAQRFAGYYDNADFGKKLLGILDSKK